MTEREDDVAGAVGELATPLVARAGAELVEVQVRGGRGRSLVRLVVDREGGIDVDTCAVLSRDVGAALDRTTLIDSGYTLEVTSPGVDRRLASERDFARMVGREVSVAAREGEGTREIVGVVVSVDPTAVTIAVGDEHVPVPLVNIEHGKVVLPW